MSDIFLGEPRYTTIQSARQATSARPQHFDGFPKCWVAPYHHRLQESIYNVVCFVDAIFVNHSVCSVESVFKRLIGGASWAIRGSGSEAKKS
jgi:hypothetical protein